MTQPMKLEKNTIKMWCRRNLALPNLLKIIGKGDEEKENFRKSLNECLDPRKTKMIVEFNDHESSSIKSFAVKKKRYD